MAEIADDCSQSAEKKARSFTRSSSARSADLGGSAEKLISPLGPYWAHPALSPGECATSVSRWAPMRISAIWC